MESHEEETYAVPVRPRKWRRVGSGALRALAAITIAVAGMIAVLGLYSVFWEFYYNTVSQNGLTPWVEAVYLGIFTMLIFPMAVLSGVISRRWWISALGPFILGCLLWYFLIYPPEYRSKEDILMLAFFHGIGVIVTAIFSRLGTRLSPVRIGRYLWVVLSGVYLGALYGFVIQMETSGWRYPILIIMAIATGIFLSLAVLFLSTWRMADPGRRWMLRAGALIWIITLVVAGLNLLDLTGQIPAVWSNITVVAMVGSGAMSALLFFAVVTRGRRFLRRLPISIIPMAGAIAAFVVTFRVMGSLSSDYNYSEYEGPLQSMYVGFQIDSNMKAYFELGDGYIKVNKSLDELIMSPLIKGERHGVFLSYPLVKLPFSPEDLPDSCRQVQAQFSVYRFDMLDTSMDGSLDFISCGATVMSEWMEGDDVWAYQANRHIEKLSFTLETVDVVPISLNERISSAKIIVAPGREGGNTVGLAIGLMLGEDMVRDIMRNGESVIAEMVVTDSSGWVVATQRDTIAGLGFT